MSAELAVEGIAEDDAFADDAGEADDLDYVAEGEWGGLSAEGLEAGVFVLDLYVVAGDVGNDGALDADAVIQGLAQSVLPEARDGGAWCVERIGGDGVNDAYVLGRRGPDLDACDLTLVVGEGITNALDADDGAGLSREGGGEREPDGAVAGRGAEAQDGPRALALDAADEALDLNPASLLGAGGGLVEGEAAGLGETDVAIGLDGAGDEHGGKGAHAGDAGDDNAGTRRRRDKGGIAPGDADAATGVLHEEEFDFWGGPGDDAGDLGGVGALGIGGGELHDGVGEAEFFEVAGARCVLGVECAGAPECLAEIGLGADVGR